MNDFDALMAVNVALVVVAVARSRPTSFIWLGQQMITIRAFANIRSFGQPASQVFLPSGLFAADRLDTAFAILALSTAITGLGLLMPASRRAAQPLVVLPVWLVRLVWLFFLLTAFSRKTIFTTGSFGSDASNYEFNFGGGNALMAGLLLYEVEVRRQAGRLSGRAAFLLVVGVMVVCYYLKGSTGYATGVLALAAFLYLAPGSGGSVRRRLLVGVAIGGVVITASLVRQVRATLSIEGTSAVGGFVERFQRSEQERDRTAEGVEGFMNGGQSAAHVVACISLQEAGRSREWRSVYYPLIYTVEPSFLLDPLGLTRPREAAWELGDYYIHSGGIEVLGELYWNGGFLCVGLVVAALALLHWRCDTLASRSSFWLMLLCNYTPGILMGGHYGFAQVARGFFNGLLVWGGLSLVGALGTRLQLLRSAPQA